MAFPPAVVCYMFYNDFNQFSVVCFYDLQFISDIRLTEGVFISETEGSTTYDFNSISLEALDIVNRPTLMLRLIVFTPCFLFKYSIQKNESENVLQ